FKPDAAARDVWTYVLGSPPVTGPKPVRISIGVEDQYAIKATDNVLNLRVIPSLALLFWLLIFTALIVSFFVLATMSNLLRDPGATPGAGIRRPYSLARTQIAWWFFIILAAYLFIGIITGDFSSSITSTVLVLLGISSATALAAATVDASKDTADKSAL